MTPEELRAIKERDALVDPYEFIAPLERIHPDGHESVHCVRDRRALLAEVEASQAREQQMIEAFEEARDAVLHGRGPLEATLDNDQTNAVLGVLDDAFSAYLAAREKTK